MSEHKLKASPEDGTKLADAQPASAPHVKRESESGNVESTGSSGASNSPTSANEEVVAFTDDYEDEHISYEGSDDGVFDEDDDEDDFIHDGLPVNEAHFVDSTKPKVHDCAAHTYAARRT